MNDENDLIGGFTVKRATVYELGTGDVLRREAEAWLDVGGGGPVSCYAGKPNEPRRRYKESAAEPGTALMLDGLWDDLLEKFPDWPDLAAVTESDIAWAKAEIEAGC